MALLRLLYYFTVELTQTLRKVREAKVPGSDRYGFNAL